MENSTLPDNTGLRVTNQDRLVAVAGIFTAVNRQAEGKLEPGDRDNIKSLFLLTGQTRERAQEMTERVLGKIES